MRIHLDYEFTETGQMEKFKHHPTPSEMGLLEGRQHAVKDESDV